MVYFFHYGHLLLSSCCAIRKKICPFLQETSTDDREQVRWFPVFLCLGVLFILVFGLYCFILFFSVLSGSLRKTIVEDFEQYFIVCLYSLLFLLFLGGLCGKDIMYYTLKLLKRCGIYKKGNSSVFIFTLVQPDRPAY